jgi:hypothetical protein
MHDGNRSRSSNPLGPVCPTAELAALATDAGGSLAVADIGFVGDVRPTDSVLDNLDEPVATVGPALWAPLSGCAALVANLECPITRRDVPAADKPHNFRARREAIGLFDSRALLTLANNHIMDFGSTGLCDTLDVLGGAGIAYAGAGRTLAEASEPRHVSRPGVTLALIGAADTRFQAATRRTPGTCPAVLGLLAERIADARRRTPLVVVSIHIGLEHVRAPSTHQRRLAEHCLEHGARVVHFHHAHVTSGCAGDGRGIVLFGTGNYLGASESWFCLGRSRQTAAWRVRYDTRHDAVTALAAHPLWIDDRGVPRARAGRWRARATRRFARWSQMAADDRLRRLWRARELVSPHFLIPTIRNYARLVQCRGALPVWHDLVEGVRRQ